MDPTEMFERAATAAAARARSVRQEQMDLPTPCSGWHVAALLAHMAGGPEYLLGSLGIDAEGTSPWPDPIAIECCLAALRAPGALERRCLSPAGSEWSVAEAAAGTAMDQLVHTWDLAVAIDADRRLDSEVADVVFATFLPQGPEVGRRAGRVGPAVAVAAGAPSQDVLLGAMGRDPRR